MAVISVSTKAGSWDGGANSERNNLLYEVLRRRYKFTKLVYVSSPADGPETIMSSIAVPQVGDNYSLFNDADILATCVSVKPRPTNSPLLWEVDCEFDTDRITAAVTDHPLNQPPDIRWTFAKYEKALLRTSDGVPVVNSAQDMYDPPLTWEDARPTLDIVRNEATFSPSNAFQFHNTLNRVTYATASPTFAKMNFITGHQQYSLGIPYFQVAYQIEFCRESYAERILDRGFKGYIDPGDGTLIFGLFRDPITFQPLSDPTLMNGNGRARRDAVGYLVGNIDGVVTSITFTEGLLFPAGSVPFNIYGYRPSGDDYFEIRIGGEVMQVTSVAGSFSPSGADNRITVTVTRGYAGTTAASHTDGDTVTLEPYYKRFIRNDVKDWASLSLPVV